VQIMMILAFVIAAIVAWVFLTMNQAKDSTIKAIEFFKNADRSKLAGLLTQSHENKWHACFILDHYRAKDELTPDDIEVIIMINSASPFIFSLKEQREFDPFMDAVVNKHIFNI